MKKYDMDCICYSCGWEGEEIELQDYKNDGNYVCCPVCESDEVYFK